MLHRRRQLLTIHQKVAVARNGENGAPRQDTGCNTGRHAIAHGTRSRGKLYFVPMRQTTVLMKPMQPARKVAGTVRQDRIVR